MLIIVWCRTKIDPTIIDGSVLFQAKHPVYSLQQRNERFSPVGTAEAFQDFMLFNKYADIFQTNYNPLYDFESPFYFMPSNCKKEHSFVLPQVPSPVVAIIGEYEEGSIQAEVQNYLQKLWNW
jgi:hypothetical protein